MYKGDGSKQIEDLINAVENARQQAFRAQRFELGPEATIYLGHDHFRYLYMLRMQEGLVTKDKTGRPSHFMGVKVEEVQRLNYLRLA